MLGSRIAITSRLAACGSLASLSGQSGGCGRCCLLYRACVMVLVARQSGSASESLLAIGIRTLVGPFARVDAAVSRKRTAITEGL